MPTAHITSSDPVDLAVAGSVNLKKLTPSTPRGYLEVMAPSGKMIPSGVRVLNPLQQWEIEYELLDDASLTLVFGAAVNTDYLITAASVNCQPKKNPIVNITVIKPSSAGMIKAYAGTVELTLVGGEGIVNKFGATAAASFISSQATVSMQSLDADNETSGDFEADGIYRFNFKLDVTMEAYGAITIPAGADLVHNAPATPSEAPEDWQKYQASFSTYMDPEPEVEA